ncbi:MAG: hypothetical protein AB7D92_03300 [Sphaerochaeta sp.]
MKKHKIFTVFTLATLVSLLLLSCNADATAGLFRQISEAKAPVGIVYKQIVGLVDPISSPKVLYFLTDDGLYKKVDGAGTTRIVANSENNIITTAALDGTTAVAYQVHYPTTVDEDAYKIIHVKSLTGGADTTSDFSGFDSVVLLPNGLVLSENADTFALYDYTDNTTVDTAIGSYTGYDIASVVQSTGKEHEDPSGTTPLLVSLVNGSGNYKHVYVDGTSATELAASTSGMRFSAMSVANSVLYLMDLDDSEGIIYKANDPATAITPATTFTKIHDTAETYAMHAFMYGYYDASTSKTKLITKPSGVNDALYVLNDASGTVSAGNVTDGYGEYLDAAEIVDSFLKDDASGTLLVATLENGLYEITINPSRSSDSEEYTL